MHARITGTGSYLPGDSLEQQRSGCARRRHFRRVDRRTHGHPPAAISPPTASRLAIWRWQPAARRWRPRAFRPEDRSHHRGHLDARLRFPEHRLPAAAQARRQRRGGIRRAGGLQRVRLCADHRREVHPLRQPPLRPGGGCRSLLAHPRLERSRHLRAVRRWRRRRGARSQPSEPGILARRCMPMAATTASCSKCRAGLRRQGDRQPLLQDGRSGGVQVRRQGARRNVAQEVLDQPPAWMSRRDRLADPAPGEHPHHPVHGEKARSADGKVVTTVDQHGNTSAASMPLALDSAVRDGRIRRGQHPAAGRRRRRLHLGRRASEILKVYPQT
jgi:hypothetical protein